MDQFAQLHHIRLRSLANHCRDSGSEVAYETAAHGAGSEIVMLFQNNKLGMAYPDRL